jgi:hypothetical protein
MGKLSLMSKLIDVTGQRFGRRRSRSVTHGMASAPEYRVWSGMRTRCLNPSRKSFPNYGGRGITVCERWNSFEMGALRGRIARGWSIEKALSGSVRIIGRGALIEWNGVERTLSQWAQETGIKFATIWHRLNTGWSVVRALSTPVGTVNRWVISIAGALQLKEGTYEVS